MAKRTPKAEPYAPPPSPNPVAGPAILSIVAVDRRAAYHKLAADLQNPVDPNDAAAFIADKYGRKE